MPKYYVETGTLQEVVQANDPNKACLLAVYKATKTYHETGRNVTLGEAFIVNERGFPSNREPFILDTVNDTMVSTDTIIDEYKENGGLAGPS